MSITIEMAYLSILKYKEDIKNISVPLNTFINEDLEISAYQRLVWLTDIIGIKKYNS